MKNDVDRFVGNALQSDDITMLAVELNCLLSDDAIIISPDDNSMNLVFSAQFVKHGFGYAVSRSNFRFNDAAMFLGDGGKLGHVIHSDHLTISTQRYYRQLRYQSQQHRRTFEAKRSATSLSK